jgi:hypothetical protein
MIRIISSRVFKDKVKDVRQNSLFVKYIGDDGKENSIQFVANHSKVSTWTLDDSNEVLIEMENIIATALNNIGP